MRTTALAVISIVVAVTARPAHADIIGTFGPLTISATHQPTPQLAGFSTWTLNVTSSFPIGTFDFSISPSNPNFGFYGPMNQLNPAGVSTIFDDANGAFPFFGLDPAQDSQFKFRKIDVGTDGLYNFESDSSLRAAFDCRTNFGTNVDFVQIVTRDDSPIPVTFLGNISYFDHQFLNPVKVHGSLQLVPEPTTATLLLFGMLGCGFRRRR